MFGGDQMKHRDLKLAAARHHKLGSMNQELVRRDNPRMLLIQSRHRRCNVTHPAVCAVLLKSLVQLPTERLCFLSAALGIYAVENVVLIEALEEGVACCIALFSVRS